MMAMATKIATAQEQLREMYGEEGYRRLIRKMVEKAKRAEAKGIPELFFLAQVAKDETLPAVVRLVALVAMGES